MRACCNNHSNCKSTTRAVRSLDRADRRGDGGMHRIDHRRTKRFFEWRAMARHAGAAHDDHVGAIFFHQVAADVDHAGERVIARGGLGDAHVKRAG